ncbi:MAG: hypothetical protein AAF633_25565, partial [Chloroflexota bacterium]
MYDQINSALLNFGLAETLASILAYLSGFLIAVACTFIAYLLSRWLINRYAKRAVQRTRFHWDDYLEKHNVFKIAVLIIPTFVFYWLIPVAFSGRLPAFLVRGVIAVIQLALVAEFTLTFNQIINAVRESIEQHSFSNELPLASFAQILKIGVYGSGFIIIVSILLSEQPVVVLGSFGAFAAVLSFVYQDALRGLVAGIQLTWNNLLAKGDW